jgi:predicted MFS family arabinose efflux permease
VIYPAAMAQLMISGNGGIAAVWGAVKQLLAHPIRALAIRICISFMRLLAVVLAAIFFANNNAWAILGCIVVLFIVTAVEPSFWMAAASPSDNTESPSDNTESPSDNTASPSDNIDAL